MQKSSAFTTPNFKYTGVNWDPIGKPAFDLLIRGLISGKLKIKIEIRDKNFLENSELSMKIGNINYYYRIYQADFLDIVWNILKKYIFYNIRKIFLY